MAIITCLSFCLPECNGQPGYGGSIKDHMICAGSRNKDSCQGDSGGPLNASNGGEQIGIVSWGIGCGNGVNSGVYTEVSYFLDWISRNK